MQVDQRQELIRLQKRRMGGYNLLELDDRQVFPVLLAVCQTLVIFPDRKIDRLKFFCRSLYIFDIVIRDIIPCF